MRASLAVGAVLLATASARAAEPPFRPEAFFAGRTRSSGIQVDAFGKPVGRFTGTTVGRREADGVTTFDQTIRMEDGSVERRSFRLVRSGPDTIAVTGTAVVGTAIGRVEGRRFRLASTIRREPDNPFSAVQFDQTFTQRPDGSVANHSEVSVLGITVRRADEVFVPTRAQRDGRRRGGSPPEGRSGVRGATSGT